ncbi:putative cupredoxin [Rosa chinensis]|uniref:Putative cupredoxin n=1 Tax=Rosa chinensis TaxID=74649 RepID=A0A2P6RIV0_ROSCH|nr:umecyanin [Rosa chinensis]PRQ46337.1 putative cupredoxin [Rosa chinensis]
MDSRVALMSFVMVALLMKGAAAGIHTVNWTVPSNKSAYTTWANTSTFYLNDQLQFGWSGTHNVANATKDEYDNCLKTAKVLTSTSLTLIDLNTSGPLYFICTIDDHCESGQKLAINVTNVIGPTLTTPPPPPSSASALAVGTLFAIVSSIIVTSFIYRFILY